MLPRELFERWAPPERRWSAWAKPALFATGKELLAAAPPDVPTAQASVATGATLSAAHAEPAATVAVVDLPGGQSVQVGLALLERGFWPVPLFNTTIGQRAAIPMEEVLAALRLGYDALAQAPVPQDSPPAFLCDSRRTRVQPAPRPGDYDNRWVLFPQDFPSADCLREYGLTRVLLITDEAKPADDLAHVLRSWQDGGLAMELLRGDAPADPQPITIDRPSMYRWLWRRALCLLRLRRSAAGGFGSFVPQPSHG